MHDAVHSPSLEDSAVMWFIRFMSATPYQQACMVGFWISATVTIGAEIARDHALINPDAGFWVSSISLAICLVFGALLILERARMKAESRIG